MDASYVAMQLIIGATGLTAFFATLAWSPLLTLALTSGALMIAVLTEKESEEHV